MSETIITGGGNRTEIDPHARRIIDHLATHRGLTEARAARMSLRELVNVILRAQIELNEGVQ